MEIFPMFILVICLYAFSSCTASSPNDTDYRPPVVTTDLGKIRGSYLVSRRGKHFLAFRGIRFAKAPINELRFKAPVPIEPWNGIFDGTEDGPMCIQETEDESSMNDMSEDCLRINVYTNDLTPSKPKPVVLYLHPGGFYGLSGQSKNFAGPQFLMDRDIVFVAINYRLGILGFLSTGTKEAPGNSGLKDQVLALRWIRDHISKFGGDPKSVTIMGYSAGAMSATMHLISPMSRGLFSKVIVMSAAITTQWKMTNDQLDLAQKQARLLNCSDDSVESIMICLKSVGTTLKKVKSWISSKKGQANARDFASSIKDMFEFDRNPVLLFKPVIENDFGQERFLVEDPTRLFKTGNFARVPVIAGITEFEFLYPAIKVMEDRTLREQMTNNFSKLAPICFLYERDTEKSHRISNTLRSAFLGVTSDNKTLLSLTGLNHLFADGLIGFGMHRFVDLISEYTTVFYYEFSFTGRYSHTYYPNDKPYGAVHHDDLIYLLNSNLLPPPEDVTNPESIMVERLTRLWTEFASKGNPNNRRDAYLKDVHWQPMIPRIFNYLNIDRNLTMKNQLYLERYRVWDRLFPIEEF